MELERNALARGLDATLNRWSEALRTVEDRLRFDRALERLPREWRNLRERVLALRRDIEALLGGPLALWRDVAGDPGAQTPSENGRCGADDLLAANLARAREAARSSEESLRALAPAIAAKAESIRYAIYAAEAATLGLLRRRGRLADVRLYVLLTSELAARPLLDAARAAIAGGAQMLQLREKTLPAREFLALARALRELTAERGVIFLVNDRVDIAALVGADGVHQGQEDFSPAEARRVLGPDAIVGVSTHAVSEARAAELAGADYIGVGPIFPTNTKLHRAAVGLPYITAAQAACDLPAFAIGGVTHATLESVLNQGATRVAVCTAIIADDDIERSARWFRTQLESRARAAHAVRSPS
ncbi:MAG: thiamine phosphate synthase [Planctomycetota bacterium]